MTVRTTTSEQVDVESPNDRVDVENGDEDQFENIALRQCTANFMGTQAQHELSGEESKPMTSVDLSMDSAN